jgi:hypothetical protein
MLPIGSDLSLSGSCSEVVLSSVAMGARGGRIGCAFLPLRAGG